MDAIQHVQNVCRALKGCDPAGVFLWTDRMPSYVNSEREKIEVRICNEPAFKGQPLLVLYDDPPPRGTGTRAPMLLDQGTRDWLRRQLDAIERGELT